MRGEIVTWALLCLILSVITDGFISAIWGGWALGLAILWLRDEFAPKTRR